jgi:predicted nucleic acid-binding protein
VPDKPGSRPHCTVRLCLKGWADPVPHIFDFPRDPDDAAYVDLAAASGATFLVTRDKDLLSLTTDHSIEAKQFRQRFPSLSIVTVEDFLAAMMPHPGKIAP